MNLKSDFLTVSFAEYGSFLEDPSVGASLNQLQKSSENEK